MVGHRTARHDRFGWAGARLDDVLLRQDVVVREASAALLRAKLVRQEAGFRAEEIAQAKADLERAKARLLQTRAQHERSKQLAASGALSQTEFDTTLADFRAAEAEVALRQAEHDLRKSGYRKEDIDIARAELRAAEAELERAKWKVGACTLKAPSSGIVLERFAQPGDWLSPTVSPSALRERPTAVVSVADPKAVHAWIDVNQRDIERVSVGQTALLATDAQPGRQVPGRVSRILPKANLQKNTARVNVEIPDVPAGFRPEMSVKVTFVPAEAESRYAPGVAIPSQAVVRDGPKTTVLVLAQGRVRVREVEVSGEAGGRVTLRSGVAAGDQVVLNPEGLSDGQAVELKK
ncbi:MAG: efflux RND transporter periplasmic adaptor subunit, partial [Gemmataceae bacterium]